jgi:hypothetical protein
MTAWKERIGEKGRTGEPAAGYSGSTPSCAVTSRAPINTHSARVDTIGRRFVTTVFCR